MSQPFIGEIKMFGGNFAPRGYAFCDGQLLPISSNTALFSILGTIYGGDGRTTFALPDLRSRSPMHEGRGPGLPTVVLGQRTGNPTTTLLSQNLPAHGHSAGTLSVSVSPASGASDEPAGNVLAGVDEDLYAPATGPLTTMGVGSIQGQTGLTGSNQSFSNQSPVTVINFIIALQGLFPSRS